MLQTKFKRARGARTMLLAGASSLLIAGTAFAQESSHRFDIPAETVVESLQAFAKQSGRQVLFPYDAVTGKMAPAISGTFNDREVLDRLAAAGGLVVTSDDSRTITLQSRTERPQAAPAGTPSSPTSTASLAAAGAGGSQEVDEVVVTGSRVSNGNNSPTPLTVISTNQLLETQPTTVAAALQNIPVFQGSLGQSSGAGGNQAGGPNGSANAVNIRNLGMTRTLVLFDGQRLQPTTDTGVVTLDMIPEMLLQRVDVVTGGASAVYGSDAISGVVNFVTTRNFNGMAIKAQSGISERGDGAIKSFGIAAGSRVLGDRGHVEASYEYYNDKGVFDMYSREVGNNYLLAGATVGSTAAPGTAANPYKLYSDVHLSTSSFGGLIRSGPLAGQNFTQNGVLSPFQNGAATGTNGFQVGGGGAYNFNSSLKGGLRSDRVLGRFDYNFTDTTHFYFQALGAKYRNTFNNYSLPFDNVTLSTSNAFLPAAYRTAMASVSTFTLSQIPQQKAPHTSTFDMESYQLITGLDGSLGRFNWDVSASHAYSQATWHILRNPNFLKQAAALDAVVNPANGQIVCRVTLTNPTAFPGCAPLNLFGPTAASAEALDYFTDLSIASTTQYQDEINGSVTGAPFSTWAGPAKIALSGEWRRAYYRTDSNSTPAELANCSLLPNTMNCTPTTALHRVTFRTSTPVSQTVGEGAAEADLPLLKDAPLVQSLNLNLAARYASYSGIGEAWTWKAGLDWHLNNELRVRATRSRDFRAPTLNQLSSPASVARANVRDELTGAQLASIPTETGGNPNLKPEVGDTLTVGLIYQPQWLGGFSVSVDYYDIKVTDALVIVNGAATPVQRQCNASGGTSPYCDLVVRPLPITNTTTANNATYFYNKNVNAASIASHGVDFEANYATRVFDHPFTVRALGT